MSGENGGGAEVIDLAQLAQRSCGVNYDGVIQRMGVELGQAAARIYLLLAQVESLQAANTTLTSALEEASRKLLLDTRMP